jgi:hypothetical protein
MGPWRAASAAVAVPLEAVAGFASRGLWFTLVALVVYDARRRWSPPSSGPNLALRAGAHVGFQTITAVRRARHDAIDPKRTSHLSPVATSPPGGL